MSIIKSKTYVERGMTAEEIDEHIKELRNEKNVNFLDGTKEEREKAMKEFFGLSEDQSFQDIKVDDDSSDKDHNIS